MSFTQLDYHWFSRQDDKRRMVAESLLSACVAVTFSGILSHFFLWFALVAGIAFSRVWTGVQYPSDVIGGAVIGIVAAALIHQLFKSSSSALKGLKKFIHWYESVESRIWRRNEAPRPSVNK